MITDVIDDAEVKNGVREDGTIYSVYSFARKLGQALSAGMTGALLSLIGYHECHGVRAGNHGADFRFPVLQPLVGFGFGGIVFDCALSA